jgi:hypothetical protein
VDSRVPDGEWCTENDLCMEGSCCGYEVQRAPFLTKNLKALVKTICLPTNQEKVEIEEKVEIVPEPIVKPKEDKKSDNKDGDVRLESYPKGRINIY